MAKQHDFITSNCSKITEFGIGSDCKAEGLLISPLLHLSINYKAYGIWWWLLLFGAFMGPLNCISVTSLRLHHHLTLLSLDSLHKYREEQYLGLANTSFHLFGNQSI